MFLFLSLCLTWKRPNHAAISPPNPTVFLLWEERLEGDWKETSALKFKQAGICFPEQAVLYDQYSNSGDRIKVPQKLSPTLCVSAVGTVRI